MKFDAFLDHGLWGALAYLGAFTLKIVVTSVVMTFFWARAGQATLLTIAMHGLSNDVARIGGLADGDTWHSSAISELNLAAPFIVLALALIPYANRKGWATCGPFHPSQDGERRPQLLIRHPLCRAMCVSSWACEFMARLCPANGPEELDLDGLFRAALETASESQVKNGEFIPFGFWIGQDGEVAMFGADPGLGRASAVDGGAAGHSATGMRDDCAPELIAAFASTKPRLPWQTGDPPRTPAHREPTREPWNPGSSHGI